ncbi:hypothetical protein PFMALIP_01251 [Plasmodium falciparum MaliPS096_E11]|uniref:Uncharacterized protein n=1 Tax=Plasmodium falciparum MaliPS096_E11 TaxID=1036727 RepID=A0A024WVE2_PLAFA|nr:hypothetical protein PFMALIP_01251 [Plasmodium falciparum MaliPS096_E11]
MDPHARFFNHPVVLLLTTDKQKFRQKLYN